MRARRRPSLASGAFLARLDGSCKTPIAGLAEIDDGILRFRGLILTPDGSQWHRARADRRRRARESIGSDAGEELLARAGPDFLAKPHVMRLLVTRPEPDASREAETLTARGHEPVLAPLLAIEFDRGVAFGLAGRKP